MENKYIKLISEDAKRHNRRIKVQHPARFSIDEGETGWASCTIVDINRNLDGIGIKFHDLKNLEIGSMVIFDLLVPGELVPVCIKGILRWINQEENGFFAGIQLIEREENLKKIILEGD